MTRRQLGLVLTLPLVAGLLAGCGSDGPADPAADGGSGPGGAASAVTGSPSARTDLLREELTSTCLADAPDGTATPGGPGSPTATASPTGEAPRYAWLDPAPGASPADALQAAADGAREDLGLTVSVGLRDRGSGQATTAGEQRTYPSASLSKVPVAMTFLRLQRAADVELTDHDRALLSASLIESDNPSASAIYARTGTTPAEQSAALQETFDLLGMDNRAAEVHPGTTPTSVEDQLRLLDALRDPPEWLHPDDADLLAELMAVPTGQDGTADPSQDVGVGSLALPPEEAPAADVHVKNGWIDDTYEGTGIWSAGSTGYGQVNDVPLDMSILLDGAPGYDCAFSALDAMAEVGAQTAGS